MGNIQSVRKVKKSRVPQVPRLIEAATDGHRDKVNFFLKYDEGAHVDVACQPSGVTALMVASLNGHFDIVSFLLTKGANVNKQCSDGSTALMAASLNSHTQIARLLLEKGANVTDQRKDGATALMACATVGAVQIADLLLQGDSSHVDTYNQWQQTAFLIAVMHGHVDIVKLLLRHGASRDVTDHNSCTPLMYATFRSQPNTQLVNLLIQDAADGTSQNCVHPSEINPMLVELESETSNLSELIPRTVRQLEDSGSGTQAMFCGELCPCAQCNPEATPDTSPDDNPLCAITALETKIAEQSVEIDKLECELEKLRVTLAQCQLQHEDELRHLQQTAKSKQRSVDEKTRKLEETITQQRKMNEMFQRRLERERQALERNKQWCMDQILQLSHEYDHERRDQKAQYKQLDDEKHSLEIEVESRDKAVRELNCYIASLEHAHAYENWDFMRAAQRTDESNKTSGYSSEHGITLSTNASTSKLDRNPSPITTGQIQIQVNLNGSDCASIVHSKASACATSNLHRARQTEPNMPKHHFQVLTDAYLSDLSEIVGKDFWQLGPLLGVDSRTIEVLENNNQHNLKRIIYDMFLTWRKHSQKPEHEMIDELEQAVRKLKRFDMLHVLQPHIVASV